MSLPREEAEAPPKRPAFTPPTSHHDHDHFRHHDSHTISSTTFSSATMLPYGARPLSPWDFAALQPVFAHYVALHSHHNDRMSRPNPPRIRTPETLKTQKTQRTQRTQRSQRTTRQRWPGSRHLATTHSLADADTRRRWFRFLRRWNGGRLPAGWYHPQMCLRAMRAQAAAAVVSWVAADRDLLDDREDMDADEDGEDGKDDRDGHCPFLYSPASSSSSTASSSSSDGLFHPLQPPPAVLREHFVRLQELLPRSIDGSRSRGRRCARDGPRGDGNDAVPADDDKAYRRMLAILWQQRQWSQQ